MMPSKPISLRVLDIEPLTLSLKRVVFEQADGGLLPTSLPGAHLALSLAGGQRNYRNSYSVTTGPDQRSRYEIIVRRTVNSRGGSAFVHDGLRIGDLVNSAFPNSQFPIRSNARKHLLIGGGVGITPLLSFLPVLRASQQWMEVHQFAARDEVPAFEKLLAPFSGDDVHVHAGRSANPIYALLSRQPLGTQAYCCGPEALMNEVRNAAVAAGWPAARLTFESFGMLGGDTFVISLSESKREVTVGEHETMLEALENAGVEIPSLCRGGACGECLTTVIDGTPDHRDHFLSVSEKAEGRLIMPCVSRAKSQRLTIAR
jgi:dimethylamine monooxygenase subunit B